MKRTLAFLRQISQDMERLIEITTGFLIRNIVVYIRVFTCTWQPKYTRK